MKHSNLIISAAMAAAMVLPAGCKPETVTPTGLTINPQSIEIVKGETYALSVTIEPEGASTEGIIWTSSSPETAGIDAAGIVSAMAVGETTVTAALDGLSSSCKVTVKGPEAESLAINVENATISIGEQLQLNATASPEDADISDINWTSSDSSIADVDSQSGLVTANAAGSVTIKATSGNAEATCIITVAAPAKTGDYFYSDGTWSTEIVNGKQCIGIVFAVGHNEYDASDYSGSGIGKVKCNGYAVALTDASDSYAMWGPKGIELGLYPKDEFGDPIQNGSENGKYNDWSGYMYSKIAEEESEKSGGLSPDRAEGYPLFYHAMVTYSSIVPAPENTSGWFLPSISQLYKITEVSDRIESVEGGKKLANDWYGSSSEAAVDNPGPQDYFRYLMNMGTPSVSSDGKDGEWFYARSVLAF